MPQRPVLSVFARLANIPDVDPTSMAKHRRANSVTSNSSGHSSNRSRSRNPSITASLTRRGTIEAPGVAAFTSSKRASYGGGAIFTTDVGAGSVSRSNSLKTDGR